MATAKTSADAWIRAGLRALAAGGPDAVRIEKLAAELGVTKGGFYWHFTGRPDFLERMLDTWQQTVIEDVIAQVDSHGENPRERLRELFRLGITLSGSAEGLGVEPTIRDWARRDPRVAERLRGVDGRRMAFMRQLFGQFSLDELDAEARCLQAYSLLIGSYFLTADHGVLDREQVVRRAFERLLD